MVYEKIKSYFRAGIRAPDRPARSKAALPATLCIHIFFVALRPNAGHGLLIHEVSRSHTKTHHIR